MNLLKGKLTYLLAGLAVITGLLGLVFQTMDMETATAVIWSGLVVFGIRRAI